MIDTVAAANAEPRLQVKILPLYEDNYAWLLYHQNNAWIIDPGQAEPVIALLKELKVTLKGMLITHGHWDHVSGIDSLKQQFDVPVYGTKSCHHGITHEVAEGDKHNLDGVMIDVWQTPGHMANHLSFYCAQQDWLFCGDTLFSAGCGRLKQTGDMQQLFQSIQRFKALPQSTQVFCSHEYTQSNLSFAAAVEPNNPAIKDYQNKAATLRAQGKATIPSSIATELACNPFLRLDQAEVIATLSSRLNLSAQALNTPVTVFTALREWKDVF